jgi:hypothetical protein
MRAVFCQLKKCDAEQPDAIAACSTVPAIRSTRHIESISSRVIGRGVRPKVGTLNAGSGSPRSAVGCSRFDLVVGRFVGRFTFPIFHTFGSTGKT